jgi:tRNA threonylcarbamoyl adenosine modification protein YeaZ
MRVLAIDTALGACAAAVYESEQGRILAEQSVPMVRGHAEALMPLIAQVMNAAGTQFSELDRIAVTVGPGSFTGLRVGVSAARGIALAASKPVVGLSTLSAYAAPHIAVDAASPLVAAIDARHSQVYMQVFGAGGALGPPRIAGLQDAVRAAIPGPARIVGSAARMIAAAWPSDQPAPALVEAQAAPRIDWVARLGATATVGQALPKPLYLRAPDARPQDAAHLPRR